MCSGIDAMPFAFSWILNTVSKELFVGIVFASSVALVWKDLKECYDKVDGSHVFFLHREIAAMVQGDTISTYFTKLRLLWDKYSALVPFPSCECENSQANAKHLVQQQLFQFLMGLNDTFSTIRSQILLMQPLSSVNQAYSMLVQEEFQCIHLSGSSFVYSVVMSTNVFEASISIYHRFNGTYDHCKIKGHKKEQCYRLIGFPPDFKFSKKKELQAAMATNSETTVSPGLLSAPSFTQAQYQQIFKLLNKPSPADSAAILVGIVSCCLFAIANSTWILSLVLLIIYVLISIACLNFLSCALNSKFVYLPNGKQVSITHIGSLLLSPGYFLHNVLYVPGFMHNLLSISKLTQELHCVVLFYPIFFFVSRSLHWKDEGDW